MSHPGMAPAPGVADRLDAALPKGVASALGPGVPSRTYDATAPTPRPTAPSTFNCTEAAAHHRRRLVVPRRHRVDPCFSDDEWTEITTAATACQLTPGGFTSAAAIAYSRADRRTSLGDERHHLEALMDANTALHAIGGQLNSLAHFLNSGGTPNPVPAVHLLERVTLAVAHVTSAVTTLPTAGVQPTRPTTPAADITHHHRQRSRTARRNRTHPCFSDSEWADLTTAASACGLKPGGYAAAATLLAARAQNPRAAIADTRRQLEELMNANRQLAAVGNNLAQLLPHLPATGLLHDQAQRALGLVRDALDTVDTAAAAVAGK
ncbi:hypothetical protein [Actinacidiphila bryophytorum]|nr:hypothetical protein [Actinacidiphila bryophytorum]MBM9435145.1 hypothetical protein [Actinacidiphila bryophytorum]MBN6541525.1 hypothetical protein [Actinacidiphila bryophytorum]